MKTAGDFEATMAISEHAEMMDSDLNVSQPDIEDNFTDAERRKIVHKIDRRLVTALGLMFAISLIDRNNLGAANIAGLSQDLKLGEGYKYSLSILVFFIPYVVLEWPGVVMVKKLGPRIIIPAMIITWGVVMIGMGFVKSWEQLIALRVLVGAFEAGLLPGAILLLQVWYCRYDVHKRFAAFYAISVSVSSVSGILSYGFMQMSGVGGLSGWSYIFIWEGVLSIFIGVVCGMLIVDFPHKAHRSWRFLESREIRCVLNMLEKDRGDAEEEAFNLRKFLLVALDLKIWAFGLIYFASTVTAYSLVYFAPLILKHKMGFSVGVSQLLSTPPFFFAGLFMYIQGWIGDKYRVRALCILWNALQGICGLCLLSWVESAGVQYFGLCLVAASANASIACSMAYQANNVCGQWKRSFTSASLVILGGLGGVTGALVFRSEDAPKYLPGIYAAIGCCGLQIIISGILSMYFKSQNRKADKGELVIEGLADFRYTI